MLTARLGRGGALAGGGLGGGLGIGGGTVRWGHPKKVLTYCLRLQTPTSRLKPVVGRHFMMSGLPLYPSDDVFKTLSSHELPDRAIFSYFIIFGQLVTTYKPEANLLSCVKFSDASTK